MEELKQEILDWMNELDESDDVEYMKKNVLSTVIELIEYYS